MSSFSVKKFAEGGLAADEGDDTLTGGLGADGAAPTLDEASPAEINAYYAKMFATQGEMKKLISEAAERIKQQRAPSVWGSLSEGLAQPKTQPGISGTLANISSGLSDYRKNKSAFDTAQADKLMAYRLKELELGGTQTQSELDRKMKLAQLAAAQTKANAPRFSADPLGRGTIATDPRTGAAKLLPLEGAPPVSSVPNIVEKDGIKFLVENAGTPKQNLTRLPDAPLSPEEAANKAADVTEARVLATDMAKAKTVLPKARTAAERAIKGVEELLAHPGFSAAVGLPDPTKGGLGVGNVPWTPAANFEQRRKQLLGGAFLEAYTMLKGGGPISNVEGAKAEAAIVRASTAQTEDEFRTAMADYVTAIREGLANLETSASGAAFDIGKAPPSPMRGKPSLADLLAEKKRRAAGAAQ